MEDLRTRIAKYDYSDEQEQALILYFDEGIPWSDIRVWLYFPKDTENTMLGKVGRMLRHKTKAKQMSFREFIKDYKKK